ncbi:regulatory protein, luxR family [Algoriella xinjiangensis]|uniref:Regulatory protein, luxR family n=2 Tax=Algoriella TaxID=1762932 RepID=A0A1I4S6N4_9FLAO|nr:LuxR C-terminal-related transcriptional regulator [Algoriella xinjiangensis]SFM60157.1 regulatory protein, luxR family [Algoriella xinjiangensis]VDH15929.1 Putative HTH-type transcriptional regulator yhjB [Algoriella xinjiangensis]
MTFLRNIFTLIIITTVFQIGFCNTIDPNKLNNEISKLNDELKYDSAIIKLEQIINDKKSSKYDLYNAYLQKHITYKRLFIYSEAIENLESAYKIGIKSKQHKEEVETRVSIEKLFIAFDLLKYDEVKEILPQIKKENLNLVDSDTKAFYFAVLGTLNSKNKEFSLAEENYNNAIKILEKYNPKHLPNIYRKKIGLYGHLNNHNKAIESFKTGLFYAEKYKIDIYVLNMYEALTHYYSDIEDWENAYKNRIIVNDLATKYDAINQSGKLQLLEKQLLNNRNNLEIRNEKNIRIYLSILSFILVILILVLLKLYKTNQQKSLLIEKENNRMRNDLANLTKEIQCKDQAKFNLADYDLSERQLEIIRLVEQGKTNKEIGNELFISENTVKYHLKIIYNTLGIDNRNSLIND